MGPRTITGGSRVGEEIFDRLTEAQRIGAQPRAVFHVRVDAVEGVAQLDLDGFYAPGLGAIENIHDEAVHAPRLSLGAWLLSLVAGLPAPGADVETHVRFSPLPGAREYWRRDFAGRGYKSVMDASRYGRRIEHFGPFDLYFDLIASREGLRWSLSDWRLLKIPLPKFTKPAIECIEAADGESFTFDIDVVFPVIGQVVHNRGALSEVCTGAGRTPPHIRLLDADLTRGFLCREASPTAPMGTPPKAQRRCFPSAYKR